MPLYYFVGISGSLRNGSYNTALLRAAQSLLPDDVSFETASINDLPLYNSDLDLRNQLVHVTKFRNTLQMADAIIFSSPEYNYSIPGPLKNAIDWASRGKDSPLINKPVAIMGASTGLYGTARMQMHLRQAFLFNNMISLNKPEVFVTQAKSKFDAEGNLTDERTRETIRLQMDALKTLTTQMRK